MNAFEWVCVALVVITSSARLTRLATVDKLPPVVAVREWYENKTDGTGWVWLTMCGYCFSFWATALVVGSGWLSDWHTAWWLVCGTFGASYLAAILMAFDGDDGEDD